jgi:cytochrome c oxidase cbb3-type subunit 2
MAGALMSCLSYLILAAAPPTSMASPAPPTRSESWDLRWIIGAPIVEIKAPAPRDKDRLRALGRTLYQARCAGCHGQNGDGRGAFAAGLSVPPTNFVVGVYKLRSTFTGSIPTDDDLFRTVTRGIHGTPMLPWKQLSEEERWGLVYQLKAFSVRFREERPLPIRVPTPPKEDGTLRTKGAQLYARLRCAACHGEQGAADGPGAAAYLGTPVRIRDFTRGRFIRGAEMEDIFLTLRAGIDGTPMASYDALRDDEIWALAAHVRSLVRERPLHELPPARTHARTP